ncbi:MAG: hypothetical protein KA225_00365 [Thauera sp.]|nr:hypothetical protein [Thauera sp.]
MINVSWYDAQAYLAWLGEREKRDDSIACRPRRNGSTPRAADWKRPTAGTARPSIPRRPTVPCKGAQGGRCR